MNNLTNLAKKGQSIVVWSSYRTGSTAVCRILSADKKLLNLDELFHRNSDACSYDKYKNQPCIVKIQPDQIIQPYWDDLLASTYIIGLTRRSVIDQIASFYCCHVTGIWHLYKNQNRKQYHITWTKDDLEDQCRYIIDMNIKYKEFRHICSQEFVYEDIHDKLQDSGMEQSIRPQNYDQLKEAIHECLISLKNYDC